MIPVQLMLEKEEERGGALGWARPGQDRPDEEIRVGLSMNLNQTDDAKHTHTHTHRHEHKG